MEPNDVNINPTGVNFNLLNFERIGLLLPIRGSSDQKLKQFFEFCKKRQTNETEKEIILKAIEACKSNEYTETRFLNIKGFSLMKRITKKIRITD
jgi:hypothetical protein